MTGHDDFYGAIGIKVAAARKASGLTQGSLAKRIGLSRPSVANIESGRQRIDLHVMVLITEAVGHIEIPGMQATTNVVVQGATAYRARWAIEDFQKETVPGLRP